jgi:hypothetical protein
VSRAFPFLRPPKDVVAASPWSQAGPDGTTELPAVLPDWDYDTALALRRQITVDGLRARRLCGLTGDAAIDMTVRWFASSSALRGRAWQTPVPAQDGVDLAIEFELGGDELGGNLELDTVLTLRRAASGASPAAPRRPGSQLWSDRFSVLLQGDAALFPLAVADFHDLPYPSNSAWYVELGEDLEAAALGSVLLLANERNDIVVTALRSAATPNDADRRVLSVIRTDVLRALVERALTDEDFGGDEDYPNGSLGALLAAVIRTTFPGLTIDALRRERQSAPALFACRIQDATNLLGAP